MKKECQIEKYLTNYKSVIDNSSVNKWYKDLRSN